MARTQAKRSSSSSQSKRSSSSGSKGSSSRSKRSSGNAKQEETDRYKEAAEDALQQLDWAIGYLHGIHKTGISKALAQNRSYIRRRLMGKSEEPLPDEKTSET